MTVTPHIVRLALVAVAEMVVWLILTVALSSVDAMFSSISSDISTTLAFPARLFSGPYRCIATA